MAIKLYNNKIEAVIFDFDGVIVDTEPLHFESFRQILEPLGLNFTWDEYVETYIGFDDRDAFKHAHESKNISLSPEQLHTLIQQKAAIFNCVIQSGVTPYPGVIELITKISTSGTPLAICSGAIKSDITPILAMLGISDRFDIIVTADDVAVSKPDPQCYELAFSRLQTATGINFTKPTTLAIEDTPAGISAATAAGLKVCAVTNSYPTGKLTQADFTVTSLTELT